MSLPKTNTNCHVIEDVNDGKSKHTKNQLIIGQYKLLKTLQKGKFGEVKLGKHLITGEKVAIKVINKLQQKQRTFDEILREVEIMKRLDHPNIIKVLQTINTENVFYIIMEYASNGDLFQRLDYGRMEEKEALERFRQILSAVNYCHNVQNVIHRDLKPDNILLDCQNNIKIADFGLSEEFTPGEKLNTFCVGTPEYMAPEVFQGHKFDGPKVDVWSLGVILYEMLTAVIPFTGSTWPHIIARVLRGKYYEPDYLSNDCKELLSKMLVLDPNNRATMDVIVKDTHKIDAMLADQKDSQRGESASPSLGG